MNGFSQSPTEVWHAYKIGIQSVTIGDGVTSIGDSAFSGCSRLMSITIGNSVMSIGFEAFFNCTNLTIYCKAESQPSGCDPNWNDSKCPTVWGYEENE